MLRGVVFGDSLEYFAVAGPSDSQPEAGLEVRPYDGVSESLGREAQRLYEQARRDVDRFRASQQRGALAGENPIAIGSTYVATLQLQRAAEHLKLRGEAAGYDYSLRASDLQNQTRALAQAYSALGRFSGEQLAARMDGLKRAGVARLPHIRSLAAAGRWEEADALSNAILDSLNQFAVFMGGATSHYFQPFSSLDGDIKAHVAQLRREAARADLLAMRQRIAPDFETTLARCQAAVEEVGAKGSAVWIEPAETSGPRLVAYFFEEWRQVHLAALRAEAVEWSWGGSPQPIRYAELESLRAEHAAFSTKMLELVAALIAADARRANPDAASLLHGQYIEALSAIAVSAPRAELLAQCEGPLAELAEKAPRLKDRVERYRAASRPLLYWRRRVAEALAAKNLATCPQLPTAISTHATVDAGQPGLMPTGFGLASAAMISPGPAVMQRLAPMLATSPASVSELTSTGGEGSPLGSRYRERTLTLVARPAAESIAPARLALERDLWADRKVSALTLEAAIALHSARRGDFARAGGQITSLALTPLLAHSIGAHDGHLAHLPLGPLPEEPENLDLTSHVLVKATIAPDWVQHEAFFVRLR